MLAATAWLLHELLTATLRIATTYGVAEAEWALHQLTLLAFCIWHIVMVLLLALLMMVNICAAALHVHNLTGQHCLARYSCCQGVKCVKFSAHIACDIVDCLTSNWHCVLALISRVLYGILGTLASWVHVLRPECIHCTKPSPATSQHDIASATGHDNTLSATQGPAPQTCQQQLLEKSTVFCTLSLCQRTLPTPIHKAASIHMLNTDASKQIVGHELRLK